MVAQLSSNRTSANGNAIRQDSRSSESREKWLNSRATRALGTSASAKKSAVSSIWRHLPIRGAHRIILLRQGQIVVNLSSQPWGKGPSGCTSATELCNNKTLLFRRGPV